MTKIIPVFLMVFFMTSSVLLSQDKPVLSVETIWKEYKFFPSTVRGFRSMNDGNHFTKFSLVNGNRSILKYAFENHAGAGEMIFDGGKLSQLVEGAQVEEYSFSKDEKKILIQTNREKKYRRSYTATFYLYDIEKETLTPLDNKRTNQTLATFSPDGKKVAYVVDNDLFVYHLDSDKTERITHDGKVNEIINGTTDWVYEEEFAITKAFDWSMDGNMIAFIKFEEKEVKDYNMIYHHDLYPDLYTYKYPKAGEENSKVSIHIHNLSKGETVAKHYEDAEYIPRLNWSPVENKLLIQTLNRHQNHLKFILLDATTHQLAEHIVYEEKDEAYVEIDDNLIFTNDGKHFFRTSEIDGFRHIYMVNIETGQIKQITSGNWDVNDLKGIDESKKLIYYTSSERGATQKDLCSINFKGKKKTLLSKNKGTTDATFSTGMKYYISNWSDANTPPVYELRKSNGELIEVLEDNEILNFLMESYNFQKKTFLEVDGAEGKLNAWMIKPPNFDENKKYPVYFNVYNGPGSNMVNDSYGGANFAYHQLLAQNGYIVVSVDTRGTMNRGAAFKKATYLQLGKLETEDLIAVAKHFAKMNFVDETRIGIMGWSYGGYMASLALTKGADVFKMGIAVAPVTSWRFYDNIYTERFMRTPNENPNGYDDNSPINHVEKLKGNYFLIHGDGDDNVHVQNAYEMVKALVEADKQFDLFIYPNKDHGIYGGNTRNHLFQMMFNYTIKKL